MIDIKFLYDRDINIKRFAFEVRTSHVQLAGGDSHTGSYIQFTGKPYESMLIGRFVTCLQGIPSLYTDGFYLGKHGIMQSMTNARDFYSLNLIDSSNRILIVRK